MTEHHHIFELFDPSKFIQAFELDGKDHAVTIQRITGEEIEGENNRKARKPVVHLAEFPRPLVLNKTNARTLIQLYGPDYHQWNGKRFVMFPTTTKMAGETVDCIRIRKTKPPAAQQKQPKSLDDRVSTFLAYLQECKTVEEIDVLCNSDAAVKLREAVSPDVRTSILIAREKRIAEVSNAPDQS